MISRAHRAAAAVAVLAIGTLPLHSLAAWAATADSTPSPAPVLAARAAPTSKAVVSTPSTAVASSAVQNVSAAPAAAPAAPLALTAPAAPAPTAPQVAGQEATLIIPSLGLRLAVVLGGQATIDRGVVAHYEGSGWRPPVPAGAPGTYWLAAHHATHGSPFATLPNIKVGALIIIDPVGGAEVTYAVTSAQVVGTTASMQTVYGPDTTTPRILLQTCEGGAYRLLVHGTRVA